jgi:thiamine-phosphate pyrophosphorylase
MPRTFQLCYITDRRQLPSESVSVRIQQAIRAGIDLVEIREKDLTTRELLDLVRTAMEAIGEQPTGGTRVVVNDRLDVALAAGAHGVHLGTRSMPARVVRSHVPPDFLVGVSCHSLPEALAAASAGADYLVLGPVFETPSKLAYGPPLGLAKLQEVTAQVKLPVLALGGITLERVKACLENGAAGIAGIRIFQDCDSLEARLRELRAQFGA